MKEISIAVSEFKARCLRLLDDAAADNCALVITKHGKPIARVTPIHDETPRLSGTWRETVRIVGDIVGFDTGEDWEVLS